jgi:hypothetical protein
MWALTAIGSGLLSGLGADIYKKLTGGGASPTVLVDLSTRAIYEIGNIVRQTLSEFAVMECNSHINALQIQIEEYLSDPQNNAFRLTDAVIESNRLVSRLQGLDLAGFGGFMVAAGLRLAVLQERAKFVPSEKKNLKARAMEYSVYAQAAHDKMIKQFHARFSECRIQKEFQGGHMGGPLGWGWGWEYSIDGQTGPTRKGFNFGKEQAEEDCLKRKHVEWFDMYMPVMERGNAIFYTYEQWRRLAKSL